MNWQALLYAIGLCLISIIIEGISASKAGKQWFEQLRQPPFSFPFAVWYVVGGLYYLLCGTIAYRLFDAGASLLSLPVVLLAAIMVVNGLTNFILFKYKSLKWFYYVLYPFAALFLWLVALLVKTDMVSAGLAMLYALWLVYDLYYFYRLWKLNINGSSKDA